MSPAGKFLLILSVMVISTIAGAWSVRRWPLSRRWIDPLVRFTIVGLIPTLSLLSVWNLRLSWSLVWLPVVFLAYTVAWALAGVILARLHRLPPRDAGSFMLASGMSNCGFTMGGFVCYAVLRPADQALGQSLLYMLPWTTLCYGLFFPWAAAYGEKARQLRQRAGGGTHRPIPRFTWRTWLASLVHWRSLGIAGTVAGLALNVLGQQAPGLGLQQAFYAVEPAILPLMVLINACSFFSIGHALRLRAVRLYTRLYVSLGVLRFVYGPLVAVGVVALLRAGGVHLAPPAEHVLLIQGAMPTAVFGTLISQACQLNARLASLLFVVNTLTFLVLVLPVIVWATS